jgi:replicative DNA helicase
MSMPEPPQNIEAEQAVLGSILLNRDAIIAVAAWLRPDYFYLQRHAQIYAAMLACYNRRVPPDTRTVADELRRNSQLDLVGGIVYLGQIIDSVPTSYHVEYYARIVERTALLRKLIEAGSRIAALGYDESQDLEVTLDRAESALFEVSQRRSTQDFVPISQVIEAYYEQINYLQEHRGDVVGVPTAFRDLDQITGGLQRSDLIILAARPSVGKCLAWWSLIDDPLTGERLTIEQWVRQRRRTVWGVDAAGALRQMSIGEWVDSGEQPCVRVRTRSGRIVDVTPQHPFLTPAGWIPLRHLRVGDRIGVPRRLDCRGDAAAVTPDLARLAGYILVGGHVDAGTLHFAAMPRVAAQDLRRVIGRCFPASPAVGAIAERRPAIIDHDPVLVWWLALAGPQQPMLRRIPPLVWRWPAAALVELLRAVVRLTRRRDSPEDAVRLHLSIDGAGLAADVQHLCVRLGIAAAMRRIAGDTWLVDLIDPFVVDPVETSHGSSCSHDITYDTILSLEHIGVHRVYDLCVPEAANFIANDIIVHNTSFAMSVAYNVAMVSQSRVGVFSLEMSREQLVQRLISMDTGIDTHRLRTGQLRDDEMERVMASMGRMASAPIFIEDTPALSITDVRSKARRLQSQSGVDLLVIDYLQLMQGRRSENRVQEVSEISRGLKALARELNVPVIALSQLSRAVEGRTNHVPMLSDLRESGCLAGDSSVLLPSGAGERIDVLAGHAAGTVMAYDPAAHACLPRPMRSGFASGMRPTFRLILADGRSLRATANHRVYTPDGWVRIDCLVPGTLVACSAASPQVVWCPVSTIVAGRVEPVYDLTIAGLASFIANGIVVHNSIEQDADIVMFIYREELYDKETDKKGIAEIHIAKHRNGPIGVIPMRFEASTTRFLDLTYRTPEGY